jgi:hypothetical protein
VARTAATSVRFSEIPEKTVAFSFGLSIASAPVERFNVGAPGSASERWHIMKHRFICAVPLTAVVILAGAACSSMGSSDSAPA